MTRTSNNSPAPFKVTDVRSNSALTLCQYFSLDNPSEDDILFLLVARRSGRTVAKQLAAELNWTCEPAIRAVDILSS